MSDKLNLNNIFLEIDKEIYIEEIIIWLNERKKFGNKLKPIISGKTVELIIMKELSKEEIEKLKSEKSESLDKVVKK